MAYDGELADRIRDLLAAEPGSSEKRMFGGLAFMVNGHMALACNSRGGLMIRIDPTQTDDLIQEPGASRTVMQGRELSGWLDIELEPEATDEELGRWLDLGVDFARSLPPK